MPEIPRRPAIYLLLASVHEPRIVLAALTRLRWLAVIGQLTATLAAILVLHLRLPLGPIAAIIFATAASNVALTLGLKLVRPPGWLVGAVLLLDVCLLSALLYFTGGSQNPFASLYLVHVAMAVIVLGAGWTWTVVATVAACYGVLFLWYQPLSSAQPLPLWAARAGDWTALVLVSVLIATFIGRVIRSLRQRERELAEAHERAANNEQLAALTTLAAGAAHELNTPLGTIAIVARELELSCEPMAARTAAVAGDTAGRPAGMASADTLARSVRDDARLIRREVDRCRAILGRMRLDVDEDITHRSQVSLAQLASRLRQDLRDEEAARLQVRCVPPTLTAMLPPRATEQALLVLLRNAFDASGSESQVWLDMAQRDDAVRFEVRDRGPGIPQEMLRRVGEPFFTTKQPGKGMGLGLFLVRLVAERCGGSFSLESRPGEGTRCVLEMPVATSSPSGEPNNSIHETNAPRQV